MNDIYVSKDDAIIIFPTEAFTEREYENTRCKVVLSYKAFKDILKYKPFLKDHVFSTYYMHASLIPLNAFESYMKIKMDNGFIDGEIYQNKMFVIMSRIKAKIKTLKECAHAFI